MMLLGERLFWSLPVAAPDTGALTGNPFFIIASMMLGAALGSFCHAAALRLNRGESLLPPSRCRDCQHPIPPSANLPVIGWLAARGRCRNCGNPFSITYLLSECAMAALTALIALLFPLPLALLILIATICVSISIISDADAMLLHLPVIILMAAAGILAAFSLDMTVPPLVSLAGIAIAATTMLVIDATYHIIRGRHGFGEGDIWLMGAIGAWLGPLGAMLVFFAASLLGALLGIALVLTGRKAPATAIPFGVVLGGIFLAFILINGGLIRLHDDFLTVS